MIEVLPTDWSPMKTSLYLRKGRPPAEVAPLLLSVLIEPLSRFGVANAEDARAQCVARCAQKELAMALHPNR